MKNQFKFIITAIVFVFATPLSNAQTAKQKQVNWLANDIAIAFIDYQPSQIDGIRSGNKDLIELNTRLLARMAISDKIPVVLSTVVVKMGYNKPTVESIKNELPGIPEIDRTSMNAWEDANFREAIKKTGKKKIVIVGLWTEICVTFPVIDMLANGYEIMVITDAIGGTSLEAHQIAIQRMIQAGAIPNTALAFACEISPDWAKPLTSNVKTHWSWYEEQLAKINSNSSNSIAQTTESNSSNFNASQLQWSAIELDEKQYIDMYHLAKDILHFKPTYDVPNFSVFKLPNGSLFELYGPGSPKGPWMNGKNGSASGFAVDNLDIAIQEIVKAGCELVEGVQIVPKAGENGADYKYQLFRAADGRIYGLAQSK